MTFAIRTPLAAIMIPVVMAASGCTTLSHKSMTLARHASIRSVSIAKSVEVPEFPKVAGPTANTAWMAFGSLAGATALMSENPDSQKLEKLFTDNNFDIGDVVRQEFISRLTETRAFPEVDVEGGDAVFDLTIDDYGVLTGPLSPMSPINPPLRPFMVVTAKLSARNGEVLWQNKANLTRVEKRIDAYPFVDMLANPKRTQDAFRKAARLVVAEVLRDLGEHPSAASQTPPVQRVTSAQSVTLSSNPPVNGALVAPGASWLYEFRDKIYTEKDARITVRVLRADDQIVEEQLAARVGATRATAVRREIDARSTSFDQYRLGTSEEALTEFAPYLFAAGGERAVRDVTGADGYPTEGGEVWNVHAAPAVWDKVTVPAGTFRALRLEIEGQRRVMAYDEATRFVVRVWYAGGVKRYVKLEHKTWNHFEKFVTDEVVELLKFNPPS